MNVLTYEQLKARLDAVVAEFARVKLIAKDLASEAAQTAGEYDDLCKEIDAETPNVTAALAEVEARAIEKFAAFLDEPIDGKQCFEHAAGLARHFASTLREGRV